MGTIPHVKAGDPITADLFNAVAEKLERFANLKSGSPYVRLWETPTGKAIALAFPQPTYAMLSGSTSPYSFTEVRDGPGGTWVAMPNGDSGTSNVYEVNGKSGLGGKVVPIEWTAAGDWRFQWVGYGPPPPCTSGRICVTVVASNCAIPITGVTITITDNASPPNVVGSPVQTGVIDSVAVTNAGFGYTNGTGYALGISGDGTGATGTFDVVGGSVTNIVITNAGSGYSVATITFPGAGGSRAAATAVIKGKACIALPNAGTYHVTAHIPGTTDITGTINAICGIDNNVTLTYAVATIGQVCFTLAECDCSGNNPVGGTVSISGTGTASGSTDPATGQTCFVLGVGSYSAVVTYPSGYTETTPFGVSACATTSVSTISVKAIAVGAVRCLPGCNVTFTVSGGATGSCSATPSGPLGIAVCCITFGAPIKFGTPGTITLTTSGGGTNASPYSGNCFVPSSPYSFDLANTC